MEFNDIYCMVYDTFEDEFHKASIDWHDFVKKKDIGLHFNMSDKYTKNGDHYTIVDSKKWLLARLKYGI